MAVLPGRAVSARASAGQGYSLHAACALRYKGSVMWKAIAAVAVGGSLGALLRWWLTTFLTPFFPAIPPGTLAANLIGGYIVGVAVAFFASYSALAPEWRLFFITGFCGGVPTLFHFSSQGVYL